MASLYIEKEVFDETIVDEATHNSEWVEVDRCSQVAVLVAVTKTSSPGNLTLTLEGTADQGTTAITLTFNDEGGLGLSEVYSATADDYIWLPSVVPAIRVTLDAAATTDGDNRWAVKIWVVGYRPY